MHTEEQIKNIAGALLSSFLPKDANETELSFHFTIPPNQSYKVWYKRKKAVWSFEKFEADQK